MVNGVLVNYFSDSYLSSKSLIILFCNKN